MKPKGFGACRQLRREFRLPRFAGTVCPPPWSERCPASTEESKCRLSNLAAIERPAKTSGPPPIEPASSHSVRIFISPDCPTTGGSSGLQQQFLAWPHRVQGFWRGETDSGRRRSTVQPRSSAKRFTGFPCCRTPCACRLCPGSLQNGSSRFENSCSVRLSDNKCFT